MFLERISIDPKIMHGKPCVKGTRLPVYLILDLLASGKKPEQITSEDYYPNLSLEDIQACIAYANQLVKNEEIHFYEEMLGSE